MANQIVRLDFDKKHEVHYAIPLWLRDQQIKHNLAHVKGRFSPVDTVRDGPIAVVGYGPSLKDTWEEIRAFKWVISCSGSHRFLIDRGIVPNWHCEVDPRDHKIKLLGEPHPDVEYLIASTCSPAYVKHLAKSNLKLWHIFDNTDSGKRLLPRGEWMVTGGSDVGMRAMTLAALLGFKDLHVFGMDGCYGEDGKRHAAEHPYGIKGWAEVEYGGKAYRTTIGMLESAKQVVRELDLMPKIKATFHGEGLVQAMVRDRVVPEKAPPYADMLGLQRPELISASYAEQNRQLHRDNMMYGIGGGKHAQLVLDMAKSIETTSILDYGCGKGTLAQEMPYPIWEYDPGIPGKDALPRPADLVVCTDVLEHVEPEKLNHVLDDLRRVVLKAGYFVIHTGPSSKSLPDGRNAHLIQQDRKWWVKKLSRRFQVGRTWYAAPLLTVVVGPRAA